MSLHAQDVVSVFNQSNATSTSRQHLPPNDALSPNVDLDHHIIHSSVRGNS